MLTRMSTQRRPISHEPDVPERILEAELHRFVRFHYDIVEDLARER